MYIYIFWHRAGPLAGLTLALIKLGPSTWARALIGSNPGWTFSDWAKPGSGWPYPMLSLSYIVSL